MVAYRWAMRISPTRFIRCMTDAPCSCFVYDTQCSPHAFLQPCRLTRPPQRQARSPAPPPPAPPPPLSSPTAPQTASLRRAFPCKIRRMYMCGGGNAPCLTGTGGLTLLALRPPSGLLLCKRSPPCEIRHVTCRVYLTGAPPCIRGRIPRVSVSSVHARKQRKSDQAGLVQPVLEFSQVLRLPYSNISWRLLKSRDHSALSRQ
jgi:hypothetical protein